MRVIRYILLLALLFCWSVPAALHAQSSIQGRVSNIDTGKSLAGVNVFLSGTKIGTATNLNGKYQLDNIPSGGHRLVISIIGYKRQILEIVTGPNENRVINFELTPVVYEMPTIYVGNLDKKWKKHLAKFTRLFVGQTEHADSVKILNPEVLRFDTNFWGRLRAEALAPLKIENRALGYHITYFLDEFTHNGSRTRWDGEPLYTEMSPKDSVQAAYWQQNRREAFYGSLRHFLLALLHNRTQKEGFILYNHRQGVYGFSSRSRYRISGRRLLRKAEESYLRHLSFFGRLEIIYTHDSEDKYFVRWQRSYHEGPRGVQTSYLELNERPVTVDASGEILEPYGATQFGYFAFQRLADATPSEYRPIGFMTSD